MTKQNPYCYLGTEILKNSYGIQDQRKLTDMETIVTTSRFMELINKPIKGNFSLSHLSQIHRYLFQDIYEFAGKIRTINISKDGFPFAGMQYIKQEAEKLTAHLRSESYLIGFPLPLFSERAAHYMAEINILHPFPEGNGRTQREMIRLMALNAGFVLDWSIQSPVDIFNASVRSAVITDRLANVIQTSIINTTPNQDLMNSICEINLQNRKTSNIKRGR